jgi:hypothetical protein
VSWLKFGDEWLDSPAIAGLSDAAVLLHMMALSYCTRFDTDGNLAAAALRRDRRWAGRNRTALVDAGLWQPADGAYILLDYAEHCRTVADKAKDAERMKKNRALERVDRSGANRIDQ